MQVGQRDLLVQVRVDQDDVGVAADRDGALAGVDAEELGDRGDETSTKRLMLMRPFLTPSE